MSLAYLPLLVCAVLAALAAPAYAGSSTDAAVTLAFGALTPILGALGVAAAQWVRRKTRIDLSREIDAALDLAVGYAEERARQHLAASGAKLPGADKLALARKRVADVARANRWPSWVTERAPELLEARLGLLRMRGAR